MKYLITLSFLFMSVAVIFAQHELAGTWKGFIQKAGQSTTEADVIYLTIRQTGSKVSGKTRIELLDKEVMALKSFNGELIDGEFKAEEDYVRTSTNSRQAPVCKLKYALHYIDSSRYLKGTFISTDCRGVRGNIVLFRTDDELSESEEMKGSHMWKKRFVEMYDKGYPSPEVMKIEQANFRFEPIYFDHDKSEIRPEHYDYLNRMARVLGGIHDLRVKVIGHTDAVGTDEYNIGLSERRAQAIRDYFKEQGIPAQKLEIEFKGEREPVDSNSTAAGKQRNRRVDFKFI